MNEYNYFTFNVNGIKMIEKVTLNKTSVIDSTVSGKNLSHEMTCDKFYLKVIQERDVNNYYS